jgi:hypothetical protein
MMYQVYLAISVIRTHDTNCDRHSAIKTWWMQFRNGGNYHLLSNNCCTVIYEALERGGAKRYVSFPWNPLSTPANLKDYALKLKQATQ